MTRRLSPRNASLLLTGSSSLLGLANIGLGRRLNYLEHLPIFNTLAAAMLVLVVAALVVAFVPLAKNRGRSASLWGAVVLAGALLATFLLDD